MSVRRVVYGILVIFIIAMAGPGQVSGEVATPIDSAGGLGRDDSYGYAVTNIGDINWDNITDLAISSPTEPVNVKGTSAPEADVGRVYIFFGGGTVTLDPNDADLILSGTEEGEEFGRSVTGAGDVNNDSYDDILVGSPAATNEVGKVTLFLGGPSPDATPDLVIEGEFAGDRFGQAVTGGRDLNNDSFDDFAVGAPFNDEIARDAGKTYVFFGGPQATMEERFNQVTIRIIREDNRDGTSYSLFQDRLNAMGFTASYGTTETDSTGLNDWDAYDLLIYAAANNYDYDGGGTQPRGLGFENSGAVTDLKDFVSRGGRVLLESGEVKPHVGTDFGYQVLHAQPDPYNGDDQGNLTLKTPEHPVASMKVPLPDTIIQDDATSAWDSDSLRPAEDIRETVVYDWTSSPDYFSVIAVDDDDNLANGGQIVFYSFDISTLSSLGSNPSNGMDNNEVINGLLKNTVSWLVPRGAARADIILTGEAAGGDIDKGYFGNSLTFIEDWDGDSRPDLMVGAHGSNKVSTDGGRAYIFHGVNVSAETEMSASDADQIISGTGDQDYFGYALADAGDVNGDGVSDIMIGRMTDDSTTGIVDLYFGGQSVDQSVAISGMNGEHFGQALSSAGDINDDGYDDIMVGQTGEDIPGRVSIFFGRAVFNVSISHSEADVVLSGDEAGEGFGFALASGLDMNNDSYPEFVVGEPFDRAFGDDDRDGFVDEDPPDRFDDDNDGTEGEDGTDLTDIHSGHAGLYTLIYPDVGVLLTGASNYRGVQGDTVMVELDITNIGGIPDIADLSITQNSAGWTTGFLADDGSTPLVDNGGGGAPDVGTLLPFLPETIYVTVSIPKDSVIGTRQHITVEVDLASAGFSTTTDVTIILEDVVTPLTVISSPNEFDDGFGADFAGAGDINGDGFDDYLVGVPGGSTNGQVMVFLGAPRLDNIPDLIIEGTQAGEGFGTVVDALGDINGDEFMDFAVGAPGALGGNGRGYIFMGAPILSSTPVAIIDGDGDEESFGSSFTVMEDIDGNGWGNVIVGAPGHDGMSGEDVIPDIGRIYIFFGAGYPDTSSSANVILDEGTLETYYGTSIDASGDVNGDGVADLIVGGYGNPAAANDHAGRVYIYYGHEFTNSTVQNVTIDSTSNFIFLGSGTGLSGGGLFDNDPGDLNGDGIDDIIISAPGLDEGQSDNLPDRGGIFIYWGESPGLSASLQTGHNDLVIYGDTQGGRLGYDFRLLGDIDGKGTPDLLVSVPGKYDGTHTGKLLIFKGEDLTDGVVYADDADIIIEGNEDGDLFGMAVEDFRDLNADGFFDFATTSQDPATGRRTITVFTIANPVNILSDLTNLSGKPGETLEFQVSALNLGRFQDVFDLNITSVSGWNVTVLIDGAPINDTDGDLMVDTGNISSKDFASLTVLVDIPGNATLGYMDTIIIEGISSFNTIENASIALHPRVNRYINLLPVGNTSVEVEPGLPAVFTFNLTNLDSTDDVVDLSLNGTLKLWTTSIRYAINGTLLTDTDDDGLVDTGTLGANESVLIEAVIIPPANSLSGSQDRSTFRAASSKDESDSGLVITTSAPTYGLSMTPSDTFTVQPGTEYLFDLSVTNTGNDIEEVVDMILTGESRGWTLVLYRNSGSVLDDSDGNLIVDTGALQPQYTGDYRLGIFIPKTEPAGTVQTITLTGTSSDNRSENTSISLVITVGAYGKPDISTPEEDEGEGFPGDIIYFNFTLTNNGNGPDDITIDPVGGWLTRLFVNGEQKVADLSQLGTTVTLNSSESADLSMVIEVLPSAQVAENVVSRMTVRSGIDGVRDWLNVTSRARPVAAIILPAPKEVTGNPGQKITTYFEVQNAGNGADIIDIILSSDLGWTTNIFKPSGYEAYTDSPDDPTDHLVETDLVPDTGEVPRLTSYQFGLNVSVPSYATTSDLEQVRVQLGSSLDETYFITYLVNVSTRGVGEVNVTTSGSSLKKGDPGGSANHTLSIKNNGNGPDTLLASVTQRGDALYSYRVFFASNDTEVLKNTTQGGYPLGTLAMNGAMDLRVQVDIPMSAKLSDENILNVKVTSAFSNLHQDDKDVTTQSNQYGGVTIHLPDPRNITSDPNNVIYYTIEVENTGNGEDVIDIRTESPEGFTVEMKQDLDNLFGDCTDRTKVGCVNAKPDLGPLQQGGTKDVILAIRIPTDAEANSINYFTFKAFSNQGTGVLQDEQVFSISVNQVAAIIGTIEGETTMEGLEDTILEFTARLENGGNGVDLFNVVATTVNGWELELVNTNTHNPLEDTDGDGIPDTGDLAISGVQRVTVRVTVPSVASADDEDTIRLSVRSGNDPGKTLTLSDLTAGVMVRSGVDIRGNVLGGVSQLALATPGEPFTFEIFPENTGNSEDTYNINLSTSDWGAALFSSDGSPLTKDLDGDGDPEVTILATQEQKILVKGVVPLFAVADDFKSFTVSATSKTNTNERKLVTFRVEAEPVQSLEIGAAETVMNGIMGETLTFTFTITNTGNDDEVIMVERDAGSWNKDTKILTENNVVLSGGKTKSLGPGDIVTLKVQIEIPESAESDETYFVSIVATLDSNDSISDMANFQINIPEPFLKITKISLYDAKAMVSGQTVPITTIRPGAVILEVTVSNTDPLFNVTDFSIGLSDNFMPMGQMDELTVNGTNWGESRRTFRRVGTWEIKDSYPHTFIATVLDLFNEGVTKEQTFPGAWEDNTGTSEPSFLSRLTDPGDLGGVLGGVVVVLVGLVGGFMKVKKKKEAEMPQGRADFDPENPDFVEEQVQEVFDPYANVYNTYDDQSVEPGTQQDDEVWDF